MTIEPSEQARKLAIDLYDPILQPHRNSQDILAIIQAAMDAYHSEQSKELVKDKERLDWLEQACHRPEWLINLSQDARQIIDTTMKGTKAEVER